MDQSTSVSTDTELDVDAGEIELESEIEPDNKKISTRSRVYDVEEAELDPLQPDTDNNPEDRGASKDSEKTSEYVDDDQDGQPSLRRSTRNRGATDRLIFHAKGTHSSLKSLVKGFLLGLAIHSQQLLLHQT
jgi:hypothetical protein